MKTFVPGLTLAITVLATSALFTLPAAARGAGGWPGMVGPSYPYPSYCEQCGFGWYAAPPPRPVVRYRKRRTGAN
jgi:hypothetical protein